MNLYQRIILVVGAIVFVVVLLTTQKVKEVGQGVVLRATATEYTNFASIYDISTAFVRGLAVLGATALLWFAAKGINSKKE